MASSATNHRFLLACDALSLTRNVRRLVSTVCAVLLVSAARAADISTEARTVAPPAQVGAAAATSASALIAEARRNTYPQAAVLLLRATRMALDNEQTDQSTVATRLLRALPLNSADEYATNLAEIETDLVAKRFRNAQARLAQLPLAPTTNLRRDASLSRARALEGTGQPLAAARERIAMLEVLSGARRQQSANQIWRDLGDLPAPSLAQLDRPDTTGVFGAWVALADAHYSARSMEERAARLRAWSARWQDRIARGDLPAEVRDLVPASVARGASPPTTPPLVAPTTAALNSSAPVVATNVRNVALLLPMTGPMASATRAVRDGYMAALFNTRGTRPRVRVIDTTERGIEAAYRDAINGGADFIVGPMDKQELVKLNSAGNLAVTTLALNYLPTGSAATANLIQFGLAPEDEAREVADRVLADRQRRVLVLAMRADWSTRANAAFNERFTQLGGQIVAQVGIGAPSEIEKQIREALLIGESQGRFAALTRALGFSPEFRERHRHDVDAIVLFAKPGIAQSVNPTLKYHFASDIALYATSHVFATSGGVDSDLNGIRFCDTPWHLQGDALRTQLREAFPKGSGELANLYALGVDSFNLQAQIKSLSGGSNARVAAMTGILSMGESSRIVRHLSWAVLVNGVPRPLPTTTP